MTVGELKKAIEDFLVHGEADDEVIVILPPADCLPWKGGEHSDLICTMPDTFSFGIELR